MRVRRLMPALQRENDMGGRFTKRPPICRVPFGLGLPGKTGNARSEISEADGSDPPLRGPRAGVGRVFTNPAPAPWGSLPSESILAGRRSSR